MIGSDSYLSRRADRLEHRFPDVCPKCGHPIRKTREARRRHFEQSHADAIGTAVWIDNVEFAREFVYLGPVHGERRWWVMWLDWPIEIVKMDSTRYVVSWRGTGPREGD